MWSEVAEGVATEGKIWPRAAALGERLWADPPTGNCALQCCLAPRPGRSTWLEEIMNVTTLPIL